MNEMIQKNTDFMTIYNRSHRLAAAVFMISDILNQDEELKTRIKSLSLKLVSVSVSLKDINFLDARKLIVDIEKISLELMSMLDIASISGLISKMNSDILKEEFRSFILELGRFSENFENNKSVSVKSIFTESSVAYADTNLAKINAGHDGKLNEADKNNQKNATENNGRNEGVNGNGHKRKDFRKSTILEFIKGHNVVSIKDIVPNINGCSEKTVQRELIALINEGKIKKVGERRWSKYSII
ncbi:MAG: hypothetical protein V1896_01895 [Candidatus Zambryskibacteria bacterium]